MAKKATWKQVEARAAELGANIEHEQGSGYLCAYTPKGYIWKGDGISTLVVPYANIITGQSWKREAYADLLDRMAAGVEEVGTEYEGWWVGPDDD